MGLDITYLDGQTPLDEDEKDGLLITTISTVGELDEFEQQNIETAILWTLRRSFKPATIFTEEFIRTLHKRMYGDVWSWGGKFRQSKKNIGIDPWQIPVQLKQLLDDARYWFENDTFPPDEMAVRFKHLLVSIHCFSNGNGRHSRLMADIIIEKLYKLPVFTWGAAKLSKTSDTRKEYPSAVKAADKGNYNLLLAFARS